MLRKFGIKEAERVARIANTLDEKKAILAVIKLFNIPVTLKKEVTKLRVKLTNSIKKRSKKIEKFDTKTAVEKAIILTEMAESDGLNSVSRKWDV